MKCPNCRCIVPGSLSVCNYCGYNFNTGSTKTVSVGKYGDDRIKYYRQTEGYDAYAPEYMNGRNYDLYHNNLHDYACQNEHGTQNLTYENDSFYQESRYYNSSYDSYDINNSYYNQYCNDYGYNYGRDEDKTVNCADNQDCVPAFSDSYYDSMFISRNTLLALLSINIAFLVIILELLLLLL